MVPLFNLNISVNRSISFVIRIIIQFYISQVPDTTVIFIETYPCRYATLNTHYMIVLLEFCKQICDNCFKNARLYHK